ncbi:MAG: PAQR family membrane homeostasis protein TrhA, partial [Thermoanaerobaculia bacterium]
ALASRHGTVRHVVGCAVFGTTLILLYTASTLYHSIPLGRAKAVLRVLDHSAIYLLIAGTYTPFALVSLHGPVGWWLLAAIWAAALTGIVLRAACPRVPSAIFIVLYLVMGWAVLAVLEPLLSAVPPRGFVLLLLGGVAYTAGIGFYLWRALPYHHAVWHGFVLAGSVLHFFAILFAVVLAVPG